MMPKNDKANMVGMQLASADTSMSQNSNRVSV